MIVIVDYGMGNLRSVQKAFEKVGAEAKISSEPSIFDDATALVFPGQGSFPDAVRNLTGAGLMDPLREWIRADRPFLGICLGLQLLFPGSEEGGDAKGLGVFDGKVVRFPPTGKIPHMGWNNARKTQSGRNCPIIKDIPDETHFYFVHSYYVSPDDKSIAAATTDYLVDFVSVIWKGNLYAMQFHPEKSQDHGLSIIRNFCNLYT